jgi:putative hydrolase of the HAD superfamily
VPRPGRRFDAAFIDVGGVLTMPHHETLSGHFVDAGLHLDESLLVEAHYRGVLALDLARSEPEVFDAYHRDFALATGVTAADLPAALRALERSWTTAQLWRQPLPGAAEGLAALAELGLPMVIVSNADGTIEQLLRDNAICQVGSGPGTVVDFVVDSGRVGVAKPDPRIFELACDLVGVPPARAVHIGDTYQYDVLGARAAGVHPVLLDPLDLRAGVDCDRVRTLAGAVPLITG